MLNNGKILVLSGPSGSGKSSVIKYLLSELENAAVSVSTTTRPMREGEVNGVDYDFVSKEKFQKLIQQDLLLEYEEVHGNYYGTRKDIVEDALEFGKLLIFDVDTKGRDNLAKFYSDIMVSVFITTSSKDVLADRLRSRGSETEESIKIRLQNAMKEMENIHKFDYLVVNENLEDAQKNVFDIAKLTELKPSKDLTKSLIEFWSV